MLEIGVVHLLFMINPNYIYLQGKPSFRATVQPVMQAVARKLTEHTLFGVLVNDFAYAGELSTLLDTPDPEDNNPCAMYCVVNALTFIPQKLRPEVIVDGAPSVCFIFLFIALLSKTNNLLFLIYIRNLCTSSLFSRRERILHTTCRRWWKVSHTMLTMEMAYCVHHFMITSWHVQTFLEGNLFSQNSLLHSCLSIFLTCLLIQVNYYYFQRKESKKTEKGNKRKDMDALLNSKHFFTVYCLLYSSWWGGAPPVFLFYLTEDPAGFLDLNSNVGASAAAAILRGLPWYGVEPKVHFRKATYTYVPFLVQEKARTYDYFAEFFRSMFYVFISGWCTTSNFPTNTFPSGGDHKWTCCPPYKAWTAKDDQGTWCLQSFAKPSLFTFPPLQPWDGSTTSAQYAGLWFRHSGDWPTCQYPSCTLFTIHHTCKSQGTTSWFGTKQQQQAQAWRGWRDTTIRRQCGWRTLWGCM